MTFLIRNGMLCLFNCKTVILACSMSLFCIVILNMAINISSYILDRGIIFLIISLSIQRTSMNNHRLELGRTLLLHP